MSYDILLSQFGLCKRLLLIKIQCYMTSCSSVSSDIKAPADLDPVLYDILLIHFSGIMSPTDHDLVYITSCGYGSSGVSTPAQQVAVLCNIMLIRFCQYNISC